MIKSCLAVIFLWLGWNVFAQQDPVLMRINGKDVLRSEFEYSYNLSLIHISEPTRP